jgi:lipopolysaccharide/colanic/teichoic acid biosynthesis glycosyltransferase
VPNARPTQRTARLVKELADRLIAAEGLLVAAPVIAIAAALVRLESPGPAFFKQERPGLHGRPFTIYKLRTMREAKGPDGEPLPDAERLTRLGVLLRRASIDELPQLWNVVRGELSLVGPRPLLLRYLDRYSPDQARRHEVKPGITGWSQVNGRNALSWEEKLALDVWYVDHWSLWLDARILAKTVAKVVAGSGVSQGGHVTMPEFMGSVGVGAGAGVGVGVGVGGSRESG